MQKNHLRSFLVYALIVPLLCTKTLFAIAKNSYLTQAERSFRSGQYEDALSYFLKSDGNEQVAGIAGASRIYVITGQYTAAEKICRESLKEFPDAVEIICLLAKILTLTGRSDEALSLLSGIVEGPDATQRSLVQYGKLLELRGRRAEAVPYFERAVARYNEGMITNAEDIAMTAVAAWALESYYDANDLFREALQVDPENLEAKVLWGDLFFEKYNPAEARISYGKALKQNPRYVPAMTGMAKTSEGREAEKIIQEALKINPQAVSALEVMAQMSIEDDRFETCEVYLEKMLKINPESLNAKSLQAALAYLRDNRKTYDNNRKSIESFSPGNAKFYVRIAEVCGRKYRFAEAVELSRKAIAIDPNHWNGYAVLGVNLLRLGHEEEGRARLEFSFEQDPFNYWTLNMLKILDTLTGFETRKTDHFIVRMEKTDAHVMWPYLKPLLKESWSTLTEKYEFAPKGRIIIEIFNKHDDFSVRTSGLPDIGPLVGVCFGNVITLDSPNAFKPPGSLNWQEILWHEFTHVITLQMTRNRMPRWLSEGISVFEEHQGRPEWGRKQDWELIPAVQENRLLGLRGLNEGFSKAKTHADIGMAYYQSFLVVQYIVERYGFGSLKKLIREYAVSTEMAPNFEKVFNKTLESFESEFLSWVKERIRALNIYVHQEDSNRSSGYQESQTFSPTNTADVLKKRVSQNPRDFFAQFQLGMLFYQEKEFEEAVKHLSIARDLIPEYAANPNPRMILADIYEQQGDTPAMVQELEALVKYQQHAFDACFKLAQTAYQQKNYEKSTYYLKRAIAVNPYHLNTHKTFAAMAMEQTQYETAVREYKVLLALDSTDPVKAHTDLAEALIRAGRKTEAKESALAALEIAPTFERAQVILLESLEL